MATSDFKFLMISAMYENGGNTTQRILDGHPKLHVYPFESQPGTRYVSDALSSQFPLKYRWPVIPMGMDPGAIYEAIIDEECKVRLKTPHVSKFRDRPMDLTDPERKEHFLKHLSGISNITVADVIEAFFRASFSAWKDYSGDLSDGVYVGYSPIIGVDGARMFKDMPESHMLHVVRNPYSAYADTKKRPLPLALDTYIFAWVTCLQHALAYRDRYPDNMHILRYEDIVTQREETLAPLLSALGIGWDDALSSPSWNGTPLEEVYPWGTIRTPTPEQNAKDANSLTDVERGAIHSITKVYEEVMGYDLQAILAG